MDPGEKGLYVESPPLMAEAGLQAELKRRGVSYRELAGKLEAIGVHETERNIANKIARGGFTAVFFVQCFEAIGASTIRIDD